MKKLILNHKSYFLYEDMVKYKNELDKIKPTSFELIVFPPILYLTMFKDSKYSIGTQNFYSYKSGSFTGEINLESLKDLGVNYTIIGHFERRKLSNETYEMSKEKLFKSLNSKCSTILCVGENKKTRNPFAFIKKELNYYLKHLDTSNIKYLSIAYEPNWAIGSGEIQCINKINKTIIEIKQYICDKYKIDIDVFYGGSIDIENIKEIFEICDGIILGKSSTDIEELKKYILQIK